MPFTPYKDSFDPETLVVLCAALDAACQRLHVITPDDASAEQTRRRLAELIVRRAKSGGYDQETLVDYALSHFEEFSGSVRNDGHA